MNIYFVKPVGIEGPIKIGCTRHLGERLDQLLKWSPVPLEILATAPGNFTLEKRIHAIFKDDFRHKEWFTPSPRLLEAIEQVAAGVSILDAFGLEERSRVRWHRTFPYYVLKAASA